MIKRTAVIWSATGMLLTLIFSGPAIGVQSYDAQTLMQLSGFDDQLEVLPKAVNDSFKQLMIEDGVVEPFEQQDIPQLQHAVASVFETQSLRNTVLNEMRDTLSANEIRLLVEFYSSDRGRSLREAELNNGILEHSGRFQQWYADTGFYGLDDDRQLALKDLESAMQATEGAVDAMIGMQVAMQVSLSPALPAEQRLSPQELLSAAQGQRMELTHAYRKSSLATIAFVFKDQPIEAIQAYTDVLQTEAGQNFVSALNTGLTKGLFNAAEQLGVSIQEILVGRVGQGA
ncbi:MAG: hypothetical protein AB8B84_02965 [Granulosicoccus sp.]